MKLLKQFEQTFHDVKYLHRDSTNGDKVAVFLYEDLYDLARSPKLVQRVDAQSHVQNRKNIMRGKPGRRGDGSFGERVPSVPVIPQEPGMVVGLGELATIEVGVETKILAKAMIKQIDRVYKGCQDQAATFKRHNPDCITVAIVGINNAPHCTSYEGEKPWPTDGRKHKHPIQEAAEAERRVQQFVVPYFDETLILRYAATNVDPYPFKWVDYSKTLGDYTAILVRISREYERRF